MDNYEQLVKALRCCISKNPPETCVGCTYSKCNNECAVRRMILDAAAAIEALQARVSKLEERTKAQQERLEDYMEKQLIIDRWGTKWMTSAKDVPTSAYQHGYADGFAEARAKMEVQE